MEKRFRGYTQEELERIREKKKQGMQEVTVKLTLEEARWVNSVVLSRIVEHLQTSKRYDRGDTPRWLLDQYDALSKLFDKISAVLPESE